MAMVRRIEAMILRQIDVQVVQQFGEGDYQKEGLSMKDQEVKPAPVIHVARRTARLGNNMSACPCKLEMATIPATFSVIPATRGNKVHRQDRRT